MIRSDNFPRLTADNHRNTSPATAAYNCIAWSVGDVTRWWQPGLYWPSASAPNEYGIGILVQALVSIDGIL
jgi:hypothetical protein